MHGVVKEVLKLARASKAYHGLPKDDARHSARFADQVRHGDPEYDSEHAYFELLQELGKEVDLRVVVDVISGASAGGRSEEHTSELQSLMRISYAVFCLKKKTLH